MLIPFKASWLFAIPKKIINISFSKNHAKHHFNFEGTLVEKIGLDSYYRPVVSNQMEAKGGNLSQKD